MFTVLKVLRTKRNLTQIQLADKVGLTQSEISLAESGRVVRNLDLIAIELGVDPPEDLLEEYDTWRDRQRATTQPGGTL